MAGQNKEFCVSSWYRPSLEEYIRRSKSDINLVDFLKSKADAFKLSKIKSLLSIGPGTGAVEVPLIASCCPSLTHFIGVDPNRDETDELERRMKNKLRNANLKVEIVHDHVEHWTGPDGPVDLILLVHVLYHIPDRQDLFSRCRQWLAPGGSVIIIHVAEFIFFRVAERFGVKDEKYVVRHIHSDLRQLGFQNVEEKFFPQQFDIRDRNTDMMNFLLQKEASEKELAELDAFITEILPTGIEDQQISVISWTKPLKQK